MPNLDRHDGDIDERPATPAPAGAAPVIDPAQGVIKTLGADAPQTLEEAQRDPLYRKMLSWAVDAHIGRVEEIYADEGKEIPKPVLDLIAGYAVNRGSIYALHRVAELGGTVENWHWLACGQRVQRSEQKIEAWKNAGEEGRAKIREQMEYLERVRHEGAFGPSMKEQARKDLILSYEALGESVPSELEENAA